MAEQLSPIIEETSQINSVDTSPTHEYLEVISNIGDSDTTIMADAESPVMNEIKNIPPVSNEIEPADTISQQTESAKYDPELKEYMESTFNTLTSLVNGINVGPDNWVLLLTKAMYVVSQIKSLDADKKIRLSVELVVRYLDDYTTLEDNVLIGIKSSVRAMCIAILNNTGVLSGKVTSPAVISGDPDVLATPLQITDLVIKKLINTVKSRGLDVDGVKSMFPELVVLCITTVEKYPHFTGLEKKNLVIQIIQQFLIDYIPMAMKITSDERVGLEVLSQSLPFLVDTLVNVGRGKVNYKFDFSNPEALSKLKMVGICLLSCIKRHY